LSWDGRRWTTLDSPTEQTLYAVWGAAPDDVWIGGAYDEEGVLILHFDGTSLTRVPDIGMLNSDIYAITGHGANDVYAVGGLYGDYDEELHFDGGGWTTEDSLHDASDFTAFSEAMAYDDGTTLALFPGLNHNVVYRRADDGTWTAARRPGNDSYLRALSRSVDGKPWIVEQTLDEPPEHLLHQYDGNDWQPMGEALPSMPRAIFSAADGSGSWAIGEATSLLERTENAWSAVAEVTALPPDPIFLDGAAADDLWLVSRHALSRRDASGWRVVEPIADYVTGGAIDDEGRPYVAAAAQVMYYDASEWVSLGARGHSGPLLANGPDDVWAAGNDVSHFDGTTWTSFGSGCPSSVRRFRRDPDGGVWSVTSGAIYALDPGSFDCEPLAVQDDVFSSDPPIDITWTSDGGMWAITRGAVLYQREGDMLIRRSVLPAGDHPEPLELVAVSSGKLVFVYADAPPVDNPKATSSIALVDVVSDITMGAPLDIHGGGPIWLPDAAHAAIAIGGAVLRHGY
jgi:hypothetical protein